MQPKATLRSCLGTLCGPKGLFCALVISVVSVAGLCSPASAQAPGASGGPPAAPPALVRVAPVTEQVMQRRFEVIGRLLQVNHVVVSSEEKGKISWLHVEGGQEVIGGQTVLARIEDVWVKLEVAAAESKLAASRADGELADALMEQATRDRQYYEGLRATGSAKQKEVDDSRTAERVARARIDRAKADVLTAQVELDRAQVRLKKLAVVAPFNGAIVKKMAEVGQWAEPGTPIAELVSRGQIDAVIDVPEQLVNQVQRGQQIDVYVDPLQIETSGKVAGVIPLGPSAARTFPVKIRLDDEGGQLKSGMSVTAAVPTGKQSPHLTVPRDAVLRSARDSVVWAVVDDKAIRVTVDVLFTHGDRFAVSAAPGYTGPPLQAGMAVVIEGGERLLFSGQPVKVMTRQAAATPAE